MKIPGREVNEDIIHDSELVSKLVNYIMQDGKKNRALRIVYDAFDIIEERENESPDDVFHEAVENVAPKLETRSRRVGGANYQVPYEVPSDRGVSLALRWIVNVAKSRSEANIEERLAAEVISASHQEGEAYQRKLDSHRQAEANKAFAHYRW